MDDVQLGIMRANIAMVFVNLFMVVVICFQLRSANRGRRTEDLFTLMEFLHRPPFRKARMAVLADEWPINPTAYQPVHRNIAWAVCSSFDFAGLMVYRGLVDVKVFYNYWAVPIVILAGKLDDFVAAQYFRYGDESTAVLKGRHYWPYYHILVAEARNRLSEVRAAITASHEKLTMKRKTTLIVSARDYFWNWFKRARRDLERIWEHLWR